jgi:GTP cyclohydrolase I
MSIAASSLTPDDELAETVTNLLEQLGENSDREGLLETPTRVAESLRYLTEGYAADPATIGHLCIEMRGVEKESSQTVTSCMLGVFRSDQRTRAEFLSHIQQSH